MDSIKSSINLDLRDMASSKRKCSLRMLIKPVILASILWATLHYLNKYNVKQQTDEPLQEVVLFIVMCSGGQNLALPHETSKKDGKGAGRQIEQARVLFKSAVALTHARLRFILVTDSLELFEKLVGTTSDWPTGYREKVTFQYLPVWYPPEREHLRSVFRPCSTARLFATALIPKEDAVIYMDSDILFLSPPEELWAEFKKFNSKQVAGMGESMAYYGTHPNSKTPFYGPTGLNSGLILMNMTRMRSFPGGGWDAANMRVWDKYEKLLVNPDQDVLNIVFNEHPDLHYDLSYEWNYQVYSCEGGKNFCPEGAKIIHGNSLAFFADYEWNLRALFESWRDYKLGTPLIELYKTIKEKLLQVKVNRKPSRCARVKEIDVVLTEQLLRNINKNESKPTP